MLLVIQKSKLARIKPFLSIEKVFLICLLYTSDAADERSSVDLGGRRIINKKNTIINVPTSYLVYI